MQRRTMFIKEGYVLHVSFSIFLNSSLDLCCNTKSSLWKLSSSSKNDILEITSDKDFEAALWLESQLFETCHSHYYLFKGGGML